MSAYSDYKCGAISEDEYKMFSRFENSDPYDRFTCRDCASYSECRKQVIEEGCPQCEFGMDNEQYFEKEFQLYDERGGE